MCWRLVSGNSTLHVSVELIDRQPSPGWLVVPPYRTPVGGRQGPSKSREQRQRQFADYSIGTRKSSTGRSMSAFSFFVPSEPPLGPQWSSALQGPLLESGCGLQVRRQDRRCGFLDEKLPAHPSFSCPNRLSMIHRYLDLPIYRWPETIDSLNACRFALGERNEWVCVSISERL